MAGTSKLTKQATLEDVTRRCNAAIATRAAAVDDALALMRQSSATIGESEQQISQALSVIVAAKPIFLGSSEYMVNSSRLLADVVEELESDLQELRAVNGSLAGYEAPTHEILEHIMSYSLEVIQSRIRARMSKLGGDFSASVALRPATSASLASMVRKRAEPPSHKEVLMGEVQEGAPIEALLQSGLDNFERGSEALEACFYALAAAQSLIANAARMLAGLGDKYRELGDLERGSSTPRMSDALESLERLAQDVAHQIERLNHVGSAAERVRPPLLAVMENMGKLLLSGLRTEPPAAAGDSRSEVTARDVLQQVLKGDYSQLGTFGAYASAPERESLTEALFHATRTRDTEESGHAVEALKQIALLGGGQRTDAADRLLSLSNSLSVSEAVRAAATDALIDLTGDAGSSD